MKAFTQSVDRVYVDKMLWYMLGSCEQYVRKGSCSVRVCKGNIYVHVYVSAIVKEWKMIHVYFVLSVMWSFLS